MRNATTIGLLLAAPLLLTGFTGIASAQGGTSAVGGANQCSVAVDRSQASGVFDVTRQQLSSGKCVCYVYTGPVTQGADVEQAIASLVRNRSCANARVMNAPAQAGVGGPSGAEVVGFLAVPAALTAVLASTLGGTDAPVSP